jgi:alpha-mannosidase
VYAHHDPFLPDRWDDLAYIDQGRQSFTYALLPHAGPWQSAGIVQRGFELNQPPVALVDTFHEGPLSTAGSFVEVGPPNVALTALKQAEDASGDLVLRAYEFAGQPVRALFAFAEWGRTFEVDFTAHELKTLRVGADWRPREVDLLET